MTYGLKLIHTTLCGVHFLQCTPHWIKMFVENDVKKQTLQLNDKQNISKKYT